LSSRVIRTPFPDCCNLSSVFTKCFSSVSHFSNGCRQRLFLSLRSGLPFPLTDAILKLFQQCNTLSLSYLLAVCRALLPDMGGYIKFSGAQVQSDEISPDSVPRRVGECCVRRWCWRWGCWMSWDNDDEAVHSLLPAAINKAEASTQSTHRYTRSG
jgi:hypothetical protein